MIVAISRIQKMIKTKLNQSGFYTIPVLLVIVVIVSIGFVSWRVMSKNGENDNIQSINDGSSQNPTGDSSSTDDAIWSWGGDKWMASGGTAPGCGDGPNFKAPIDVTKTTAVLYPGQKRGGDYKAHGGFLFANSKQTEVDVVTPIDSHLIKASRYIELGEVQYFMVFSVPCGFAYRFDHLQTLTPEFQAIMDKLPKAEVNNSQTTSIQPAVAVKAGTKIATGVGFKTNTTVDFGIYDVRQPNSVSKQSSYAAEHAQTKEFDYYGVCFLEYLESSAKATLSALPGGDQVAGKTSDYCR